MINTRESKRCFWKKSELILLIFTIKIIPSELSTKTTTTIHDTCVHELERISFRVSYTNYGIWIRAIVITRFLSWLFLRSTFKSMLNLWICLIYFNRFHFTNIQLSTGIYSHVKHILQDFELEIEIKTYYCIDFFVFIWIFFCT